MFIRGDVARAALSECRQDLSWHLTLRSQKVSSHLHLIRLGPNEIAIRRRELKKCIAHCRAAISFSSDGGLTVPRTSAAFKPADGSRLPGSSRRDSDSGTAPPISWRALLRC